MTEQSLNNTLDPYVIFDTWKKELNGTNPPEPDAMALSTVDGDGRITSRIVLLKGFDKSGFLFFTNYNSRKGKALSANGVASLLFYWPDLKRQVRIEGLVEKASAEVSDEYFSSRPRESRIGAWASDQSSKLSSSVEMDERLAYFSGIYPGDDIPRPEWWGGFLLKPNYFEFWTEGKHRLHNRVVFNLVAGNWERTLLWP